MAAASAPRSDSKQLGIQGSVIRDESAYINGYYNHSENLSIAGAYQGDVNGKSAAIAIKGEDGDVKIDAGANVGWNDLEGKPTKGGHVKIQKGNSYVLYEDNGITDPSMSVVATDGSGQNKFEMIAPLEQNWYVGGKWGLGGSYSPDWRFYGQKVEVKGRVFLGSMSLPCVKPVQLGAALDRFSADYYFEKENGVCPELSRIDQFVLNTQLICIPRPHLGTQRARFGQSFLSRLS